MIKYCGYEEKCFESGHQEWGIWGGGLCKHAGEEMDKGGEPFTICLKTKRKTITYCSKEQHDTLNLNNAASMISTIKCKLGDK